MRKIPQVRGGAGIREQPAPPRGRPHLAQAPALPGPSAGGHGLLCGRPFGGRGHGAAGHQSPWGNGRHFASSSSTSARLNAVVGECGVANAPVSGGSDRSAGSCPRRTVPDLLAADGVHHGVTASGPWRRRQRAGARRLAAARTAGEGQSHTGLGARSGARAV